MTPEREVLEAVTRRLDEANIPYMLTGSMAMNFYAIPRMTRDIDLVVELSPTDADQMHDLFAADFYVDLGAIREAIEQQSVLQRAIWCGSSRSNRPWSTAGWRSSPPGSPTRVYAST